MTDDLDADEALTEPIPDEEGIANEPNDDVEDDEDARDLDDDSVIEEEDQ
jgi:hypothetical protein